MNLQTFEPLFMQFLKIMCVIGALYTALSGLNLVIGGSHWRDHVTELFCALVALAGFTFLYIVL